MTSLICSPAMWPLLNEAMSNNKRLSTKKPASLQSFLDRGLCQTNGCVFFKHKMRSLTTDLLMTSPTKTKLEYVMNRISLRDHLDLSWSKDKALALLWMAYVFVHDLAKSLQKKYQKERFQIICSFLKTRGDTSPPVPYDCHVSFHTIRDHEEELWDDGDHHAFFMLNVTPRLS